MKYDEACQKLANCLQRNKTEMWASDWIDAFVSLGILKLDEPKSAEKRFLEAVCRHGFYLSVGDDVLGVIANAGLKIVEKDQ